MACLLAAAALALSGCAQARRAALFGGYRLSGKRPAVDCWRSSAYSACSYRSGSGPSDPASHLYFLHYATGDERSLERLGLARAFFARWAREGKPAPVIVSVSFGTHWLLATKPGRFQTVPLDDFADRLIPEVEERLGKPSRRGLWGMSMGGYNALTLASRRPAMWKAAVLSCPALYESDPFMAKGRTSEEERGLDLVRHRLDGSQGYAADDPLVVAPRTAGLPPLLLQVNRADEFGFGRGAEALAGALGSRAVYETLPGEHCLIDARRAAEFLSQRM